MRASTEESPKQPEYLGIVPILRKFLDERTQWNGSLHDLNRELGLRTRTQALSMAIAKLQIEGYQADKHHQTRVAYYLGAPKGNPQNRKTDSASEKKQPEDLTLHGLDASVVRRLKRFSKLVEPTDPDLYAAKVTSELLDSWLSTQESLARKAPGGDYIK